MIISESFKKPKLSLFRLSQGLSLGEHILSLSSTTTKVCQASLPRVALGRLAWQKTW